MDYDGWKDPASMQIAHLWVKIEGKYASMDPGRGLRWPGGARINNSFYYIVIHTIIIHTIIIIVF